MDLTSIVQNFFKLYYMFLLYTIQYHPPNSFTKQMWESIDKRRKLLSPKQTQVKLGLFTAREFLTQRWRTSLSGRNLNYRKGAFEQICLPLNVELKRGDRTPSNFYFSPSVQADYYTTHWECYYWPPIDGQWSSWSTTNETFQDATKCQGHLSYAIRECDSPKAKYCGQRCGENPLKIDIFPGTLSIKIKCISYLFSPAKSRIEFKNENPH